MDTTELSLLYSGYGYQVRLVDYYPGDSVKMGGADEADRELLVNLAESMDWAHSEIRAIQ